jgi:hypothetical protein
LIEIVKQKVTSRRRRIGTVGLLNPNNWECREIVHRHKDNVCFGAPQTSKGRSNIKGGITMSEFVYLYRGGEAGRSPERMQQMMQKWMAWLKQLSESGHIKDQGHPLEVEGAVEVRPVMKM